MLKLALSGIMTKLLDKLNGYKGTVIGSIGALAFAAGAAASGYLGLPDRVSDLEKDVAGIYCLISAMEQETPGDICYLLVSESTREFVERTREGATALPR